MRELPGIAESQLDHQRFDQHYGTVDDDTEVHPAQRDQIGGYAAHIHQHKSEQQRQRNHCGHGQRGLPVAQEDHQDGHHQKCANQQIVDHGMHRVFDQVGAVVIGNQLDVGRQLALQLLDFRLDADHDFGGVLPLGHQHDALHHVVAFVEGDDAGARTRADGDRCHIADQDGSAALRDDGDAPDVIQCLKQADTAYHQCLVAAPQNAAATVGAIVGQCLRHLV